MSNCGGCGDEVVMIDICWLFICFFNGMSEVLGGW